MHSQGSLRRLGSLGSGKHSAHAAPTNIKHATSWQSTPAASLLLVCCHVDRNLARLAGFDIIAKTQTSFQSACTPLLAMSLKMLKNFTLQAVLTVTAAVTCPDAWASPEDVFHQLDANRDDRVARAEIDPEKQAWFDRLLLQADKNDDRQLSLDEWQAGLTPHRIEKPFIRKTNSDLRGSDALLLLLAWMDGNTDLTVEVSEVPEELRGFFERVVNQLKLKDASEFRVNQLRQQAPRYALMAQRFAQQRGIDVEVELALLSDKQYALVERIKRPVRAGRGLSDRNNAQAIFDRLDRDGDGSVAKDEIPDAIVDRLAALFERADSDGDGRLTEREFLAFSDRGLGVPTDAQMSAQVTRRVDQMIKRGDRDGDGLLSQHEVPWLLASHFDRADRDGSGRLDRRELATVLQFMERVGRPLRSRTDRVPDGPNSPAN